MTLCLHCRQPVHLDGANVIHDTGRSFCATAGLLKGQSERNGYRMRRVLVRCGVMDVVCSAEVTPEERAGLVWDADRSAALRRANARVEVTRG